MKNIVTWINGWTGGGVYSIFIFFPMALLVLYGAIKVVKYSEVIIAKTKFGGAFVGGVLIAGVTSIPELITEIAQSSVGNPGAGTADDIGSNAFSVFLIGLSAFFFYKSMFLNKINGWTKVSILISGTLALLMTIFMLINKDIVIGTIGKFAIGIIPLSLFIFYLFSLWLQYRFGDDDEEASLAKPIDITVKKAFGLFSFWAILLVIFALGLNWVASSMGDGYELKPDSVGGIFLSITTSLPEIIAFILLVKNNQPVAAVAALIGSHLFNLGISFFGDLAYTNAPTFQNVDVGNNWPIAAMTAIMLFLLALHIIFSKKLTKKRYYFIVPTLVVATYITGWALTLTLMH